eukprot:g4351.t1
MVGEKALDERMDEEETDSEEEAEAMAVDGGGGEEEEDDDSENENSEESSEDDDEDDDEGGSFEDSDEDEDDEESDREEEDDSDDDEDEGDREDRDVLTNARVNVEDIKMHLTCRMCSGFFRDAHTIVECLHTFCKSCIMIHFKKGERSCPHCHRELSSANPEMMLRFDRTMQSLVDKIFPDIQTADREKEEAFYAARNIKRKEDVHVTAEKNLSSKENQKDSAAAKGALPQKSAATTKPRSPSDGTKTSTNEETHDGRNVRTDTKSKDVNPTSLGADVDFKLVADRDCPENLQLAPLPKPFLRTSNKLKVTHLKKYLGKKLEGVTSGEIQVAVEGHDLEPRHTLATIITEILKDASKTLVILYRRRSA